MVVKKFKNYKFILFIFISLYLLILNCNSSLKNFIDYNYFDFYCKELLNSGYFKLIKENKIDYYNLYSFINENTYKLDEKTIWDENNLKNLINRFNNIENKDEKYLDLINYLNAIAYQKLKNYDKAFFYYREIKNKPYNIFSEKYIEFIDRTYINPQKANQKTEINDKDTNNLIKSIDEMYLSFLNEHYDFFIKFFELIFETNKSSESIVKDESYYYEKKEKLKILIYNYLIDKIESQVKYEKKNKKYNDREIYEIAIDKTNQYFYNLYYLEYSVLNILYSNRINNSSNLSKIYYFLSLINLLEADYSNFLNYLIISFVVGANYYYSVLSISIFNSLFYDKENVILKYIVDIKANNIGKITSNYFYKNLDDFFNKNKIKTKLKKILIESLGFNNEEYEETINFLKILLNGGFIERFTSIINYLSTFDDDKTIYYEINRNLYFFIGNLNLTIYYQNLIFTEKSKRFSLKINNEFIMKDEKFKKLKLILEDDNRLVSKKTFKDIFKNPFELNLFLNNCFYISEETMNILNNYISSNNFEEFLFSFPIFYIDIIDKYNDRKYFNNFEILSLLREESYFNKEAYSNAGAIGLMQLMPQTAYQIYYKKNYKHDKDFLDKLKEPDFSIFLGITYLNYTYEILKSKGLSLAAYNSGPNRIKRMFENKNFNPIIDPEFIDISETQIYLKKIFRSYLYYSYIYNGLFFEESVKYILLNWIRR